ncbi:MAG: hypothetical protein PHV37_02425 [Candidatus Gastranaerophilales bacterium]|nr:hypothetical protein [Candidatus Gastranaerophilales bacterium]
MNVKKIISSFLLVTLVSLNAAPLSAESTRPDKSLYTFLKNTENIEASYKYPSIRISANNVGKAKLPAHTPIMIKCEDTISTRDVVSGGTVIFSVLADVKSDSGLVLIKAGTPVTAEITFAKKKGMIGKSGELTVNDFHTNAVDGTYIPLSASVSSQPEDSMTTSIVLSVLICPLFLLMKGDEAQVPAGMTKPSYTVTDSYINTSRL